MEGHPETITPPFPGLTKEMVLKILDKLDDQSLLSCRLVSRGLCEASTTIIQSRPAVLVMPWCPPNRLHKDSLNNLIKCFKASRKFPCHNFVLENFYGCMSECPDLKRFLNLSKPKLVIKSLQFNIRPRKHNLRDLDRLMFRNTPQLTTLSLQFHTTGIVPFRDDWRVTEKSLPSLKVLQLGHGVEAAVDFVTKILRAAPNLQRIEGADLFGFKGNPYWVFLEDHLRPILNAKKLHLVNHFKLTLMKKLAASGILDRKKLPGFQPTLLCLENLYRGADLTNPWVQNGQMESSLREVLWTVKDAVEELETDDSLGRLENSDLPVFSKLKRLHLNLQKVNYPILPRGIRNRDYIFSRLEKICLDLPKSMDENTIWPDLGHFQVMLSVNSLKIKWWGTFIGVPLQSMALMCPNLRNLELSDSNYYGCVDLSQTGPVIWNNMRRLDTLILSSYLSHEDNSLKNMEVGFTGFSLETVGQLKATEPKDRPKEEDVEHLRVNPSILQMTELKKLVMNFRYTNSSTDPVLTLSVKYAFNLMPGLIVDISLKQPH